MRLPKPTGDNYHSLRARRDTRRGVFTIRTTVKGAEMESMWTTKQVAEMLGDTQQAVYRRLRRNGCVPVMGRARDANGDPTGISDACWWTAGDIEKIKGDKRRKNQTSSSTLVADEVRDIAVVKYEP